MSHPEQPNGEPHQDTPNNGAEATVDGAATEAHPEAEAAGAALDDEVGGVSVELLQAQVGGLMTKVLELESKLGETTAKLRAVSKAYTDLQGDYDAFRQRMTQQSAVLAERKGAEAVERFFDPVQNLKRSLASAGEHADTAFAQGLQMVRHQFDEAMTKLGLEKVAGEGADFDPNLHEALAITPVADPAMDGKILHVHQDGYAVKGRVIQASQVVIGKYEAPAADAAAEEASVIDVDAAPVAKDEPGDEA